MEKRAFNFIIALALVACSPVNNGQMADNDPALSYTVSMPEPSGHLFHIKLNCKGWPEDTVEFKMAMWTPGYYQIMDYARYLRNISARDNSGNDITIEKINGNSWRVICAEYKPFNMEYDIKATRNFVASNFLDSTHAYLIPAASFLYIKRHTDIPVKIKFVMNNSRDKIATGLLPVPGKPHEYSATDFDMLYDCPVLIGDLESLPSFSIKGVEHRFIGYKMGKFDRDRFMDDLKKVVEAGVRTMGDIPYKQYTFIGIGPGRGGIEHLNNATVSFTGDGLDEPQNMNRIMNFLAHEYFHNYNVKRIRPFELGPFDYDRENKTNLLWVSEGFTVYYEYLLVRRAGLISREEFFGDLETSISATENDPGRRFQSLKQASYNTWSEGPFGSTGEGEDRSISYYDKGPVVALILDLAIRHATQDRKSLDDVMRWLYNLYYKKLERGFTDAEFQQACETVAGISLSPEFEYVNTTKEIDYNKYLSYAGLKIDVTRTKDPAVRNFSVSGMAGTDAEQRALLQSWAGN